MTLRNMATLFILSVALAACAGPVSDDAPTEIPAMVTESLVIATPTLSVPIPYPQPGVMASVPPQSAYPAPATPGTGTSAIPTGLTERLRVGGYEAFRQCSLLYRTSLVAGPRYTNGEEEWPSQCSAHCRRRRQARQHSSFPDGRPAD